MCTSTRQPFCALIPPLTSKKKKVNYARVDCKTKKVRDTSTNPSAGVDAATSTNPRIGVDATTKKVDAASKIPNTRVDASSSKMVASTLKDKPSTIEATSSSKKCKTLVQRDVEPEVEEDDDEDQVVDMYTIMPDITLKWDLLEETIDRLRVI